MYYTDMSDKKITPKHTNRQMVVCKEFRGYYETEQKTLSARYILEYLAKRTGMTLKEGRYVFTLELTDSDGDPTYAPKIWAIFPYLVDKPADIPSYEEFNSYCTDVLKIKDEDVGFNLIAPAILDLGLHYDIL